MAFRRFIYERFAHRAEAYLHRAVAVMLGCLFLHHGARAGLDHRYRDHNAVVRKHLGHAYFFA
ncbi:hypothetical protein SDC9_170295 [bioreactor metagenome]|uniref:Uncharacterized protein n=1 Tax=bioreactor metagenome TaxID=1076179 RepID=A0A645GA49_9ZZZZ